MVQYIKIYYDDQHTVIIPQSHEHFNVDLIRDKSYIPGLPRDRSHCKSMHSHDATIDLADRDTIKHDKPGADGSRYVLAYKRLD